MYGVYTYFMLALTAASTFMAADTTSRVLTLPVERVAAVLLCVWTATLVCTLLDTDCVTALAMLHAALFVACAAVTYVRHGNSACMHSDHIRYPLTVYMPLFVVAYVLHLCASTAAVPPM